MSKELQAFRDILGILSAVSGCEVDMDSERVRIVQQALLRLESIENANHSEALKIVDKMTNYILLDEEYDFIDDKEKQSIIKDRDIIKQALLKAQKEHKALEIIKEKDVNIWYLTVSTKVKNYKDYNSFLMNDKGKRHLTEEEFNLLKEVLE